jgi:hypothetical protein
MSATGRRGIFCGVRGRRGPESFSVACGTSEVAPSHCDPLQTSGLAVGRLSEGRPCRKNWTN